MSAALLDHAVRSTRVWKSERGLLAALLTAYLALWTGYAVISHLPDVVHFDMAEAYVWGLDLQLGYYKHPPLMAWVTRLWFSVFPASDAAFYLLSIANATLSLFAVWLFAGEFVRDERRILAVAALMLTPLYSFHAIKFNANTILLPLWPLAAFAFLRALRTRALCWAIAFGAAAAAAMLAKYYSGILLVGCLAAALLDADRARYFKSSAPYVTIAVFLVLVMPHLVWFMRSGGLPLRYAVETRMGHNGGNLGQISAYLLGGAAYVVPMLALLIRLGGGHAGGIRRIFAPGVRAAPDVRVKLGGPVDRQTLLVLSGSCVLLPAALGLALGVRVGATWSLPAWFAVPLLVLTAPGLSFGPAARRHGLALAGALTVGACLASPLVAFAKSRLDDSAIREPRREFAEAAGALWRERTGYPLRLVAGSDRLAEYISFYAPEHPSLFILFDAQKAPWVSPERLARDGLLIVCRDSDDACRQEAERLAGPAIGALSRARRVFGRAEPEHGAHIWIMTPRS